jgi:hypothetical protein
MQILGQMEQLPPKKGLRQDRGRQQVRNSGVVKEGRRPLLLESVEYNSQMASKQCRVVLLRLVSRDRASP